MTKTKTRQQLWWDAPLGSLATIKNGKSDTQDADEKGAYAFFDRSKAVKKSHRYLFDCEALIIPGEGTEFLPRHFQGKFDLHQRAYAIHNFSEQLDPRYLFYYLHYRRNHLPSVAVGATVKSLRMRHFEYFPIRLTSITNQKRIVAILDQSYQPIDQALETTAEAGRRISQVYDCFLDNIATSEPVKEVLLLGRVASFRNGVNFTVASRGKRVKIVGVKDFRDRFTVPEGDLDTVTLNGEINKEDLLMKGDLLTVRSNGNAALIGRTMLTGNEPLDTLHSGFTIRTRLSTQALLPAYVCHVMRSGYARRFFMESGTGINIKSLSQGTLANLQFALVPLEEQERRVAHLDNLASKRDQLLYLNKSKLSTLRALKESLLHQAFSGTL